jgi:hypothetical protein
MKFQCSVGIDGRIWEHSKAYPGSISDREIFEESQLPELFERTGLMRVGDSHYVNCLGMFGKKLGSKQSLVYKDYNQDIENVRAIIENVNHRLKVFKTIAGKWQHDRHDFDFYTDCITCVCGLVNLEVLHGHPVRVNLQTLLPRVQSMRREARQKARDKVRNTEQKDMDDAESEQEDTNGDLAEESEEEFAPVDLILSHRKGKALGKSVVFYRVKFMDGVQKDCTAENITQEALNEYLDDHDVT